MEPSLGTKKAPSFESKPSDIFQTKGYQGWLWWPVLIYTNTEGEGKKERERIDEQSWNGAD